MSHHHHDHSQKFPNGDGDSPDNLHDQLVNEEMAFILSKLTFKEGERILDYGCSKGDTAVKYFLPLAKKNSCTILGVDIKPESIKEAQEKYKDEERMSFAVGNIGDPANWPFSKDRFDKVICLHVVQYFEDYGKFFKSMHEQMKPGAQLVFTLPISLLLKVHNGVNGHPTWGKLMGDMPALGEWAVNEDFIPKMKSALELTGFAIEEWDLFKKDSDKSYESVHAFIDFMMKHYGEHSVHIPPEKKEEFKNDLTKIFLDAFGIKLDESPFILRIPTLRVIARRN